MTNTKSTKRALLTSVMALFLCFAMLLGTTYAWFTDTITSANNIIKSGNLDIELDYWNGTAWNTVEGADDIINGDLWEPGYTKVAYLRLRNAGSLALKYQLGVNILSEKEGINQAGDTFKLSDYIEFGVNEGIDGQNAAYKSREDALAAVTNAKIISEGYTKADSLAANSGYVYLAMVVYMPTDVGNVANHDGEHIPQIDLGINVLATQYTSEKDSFDDQYDANAPVLVWNGAVDTSWYNAAATTYELSTPAALAGLAKLVNEGNSFVGKDIKMVVDMDLDNIAWTTIGNNTSSFNGNFYGNGYKIYNLNVSGTKGVGLFGFAGNAAHIEGVHIVGADVTGVNSVGAVLGYGYLAANCLKNCVVEDAFVYAAAGDTKEDGDKVGAVAGWTSNGNIIGNKAINCEIYGCRDIGGVVGYVNGENRAVEVSGNTVENVTVAVVNVDGYVKTLGSNINDTVGRTGERVDVNSNNGKITKVENVVVSSSSEELKNAVGNGGQVLVTSGTYTFPGSAIKGGTTLFCAPETVFEGTSKLNINGATVVGATFSNPTGTAADQTINGTFKDCTFTGKNGLRCCYAGETVVFENCVFDGSTYGVHFDGGANEVIFKNCTISGFNAMGGAITQLTMEGCTFKANGRSGYNGINLWGDTDMIDCTFVFDGTKTEWVHMRGSNTIGTFNGCVVTDGETETPFYEVIWDNGTDNTVTVDGIPVVFDNAGLTSAVAAGATKVYLKEGEYDLNGNQKNGLVLIGLGDDVKVANTTKYASGKSIGAIWKAINLENVTITNTVYTMADGGNATFTNVTFAHGVREGYGKNVVFTNCVFGSNSEGYALHFQTDSSSEGGNIVLNGCKFEGGKVHLGGKRSYTFTNCDFTAATDFQVWSNITLEGCTVDGVVVTADNIATLFPNLNLEKVTLK